MDWDASRLRTISSSLYHPMWRCTIWYKNVSRCIEATQWFSWRLWPRAGMTVYPPNYAQLESKIPKVQNHLRIMRESNPTWGRTTSTLNNWEWGTNNWRRCESRWVNPTHWNVSEDEESDLKLVWNPKSFLAFDISWTMSSCITNLPFRM